jgi:Emfourin
MGLLATALACLAMAPGCGGPPVEAPPTVAQFKLSYERSGGLVANPRSLEIAPGRHATATRRKLASRSDSLITANFRIGVEQVKRLRNALERADFQAIADPGPGNCADCFHYSIEYREHEVTFSDVTMPPGLRSVIGRIEAMIEAHLPLH